MDLQTVVSLAILAVVAYVFIFEPILKKSEFRFKVSFETVEAAQDHYIEYMDGLEPTAANLAQAATSFVIDTIGMCGHEKARIEGPITAMTLGEEGEAAFVIVVQLYSEGSEAAPPVHISVGISTADEMIVVP